MHVHLNKQKWYFQIFHPSYLPKKTQIIKDYQKQDTRIINFKAADYAAKSFYS